MVGTQSPEPDGGAHSGTLVDAALYRGGVRSGPATTPTLGDLARWTTSALADAAAGDAEDGGFVWLRLRGVEAAELDALTGPLGLHRLAVEDAGARHRRPKLDVHAEHPEHVVAVVKPLSYHDPDDAVETGEVCLFLGARFAVAVERRHEPALDRALEFVEARPEALRHGPSAMLYALLDAVADDYLAVLDELQADVDEVEASVFSPARTDDSARIYALKREVAEVRRAVLPLREPLRRLAAGDVPGVAPHGAPFFREVAEHLSLAAELVESLDGLLSTAFDATLARISVQQNDDMRKISAGAAVVVVPTLIAGIYGMNFDRMPELAWRFGYPYALLLMAGAVMLLWWLFKRSGWL